MTPLAVGPVICILGVVAAYFALRTKANTKKSMYRKLRDERERQIRAARQRAQQAKERQLQAERDRAAAEEKAARQAAAAAAAPAAVPEPASTARIDEPARQTPMYEPPPAAAHEPEPEPQPEPEPALEADTTQRVEPPVPEFEPVSATHGTEPSVPAEAEAEPAPAADGGNSSWEIVTPEKETEPVAAATTARPAAGHADWEVAPASAEAASALPDERSKRKDKAMEIPGQDDEKVGGGPLQTALSYAGLVAALAIILLGIVFMIGSKATG